MYVALDTAEVLLALLDGESHLGIQFYYTNATGTPQVDHADIPSIFRL